MLGSGNTRIVRGAELSPRTGKQSECQLESCAQNLLSLLSSCFHFVARLPLPSVVPCSHCNFTDHTHRLQSWHSCAAHFCAGSS